jgi:glucose-1-phosphate thymidylyltransferase
MKVCCPEEICWRMGHISDEQLQNLAEKLNNNDYGKYLKGLLDE